MTVIVILGLGLTVGMGWAGQARSARDAADTMDRRALYVTEAVSLAVEATIKDARVVAGLFAASEEVTEAEFNRFVHRIGQHPGCLGIGFVSLVPSEVGDAVFPAQAESRDAGFELFQFDLEGARVPSASSATTYPVVYFASSTDSNLDLRGYDAESDPVWVDAMERAAEKKTSQVSRFTQLFGVPGHWGFLVVDPVVDGDEVVGFAVTVTPQNALLESELAESLSDVVIWDVRDTTTSAAATVSPDSLRRTTVLDFGGRAWVVEVTPTAAARAELGGAGVLPGLVVGLVITLLVALVTLLARTTVSGRLEARELRRLAEQKDEFLAAVSHELRTPLTTVVGTAELLKESKAAVDPGTAELVALLQQESRELARLVEDLLLMGRMDAQVLSIRADRVDLGWEIRRVVAEVALPPGLELSVSGEAQVWADPLRLRHVIRHLYDNALRHGGSRVKIRVEEDPHHVRVAVWDDGQGIPQGQESRLFSSYSSRKATLGGPASLGLGLRTSKRLAWAMGGDLVYRRVGAESVFELRLPRIAEPETEVAGARRPVTPGVSRLVP